MKLKSQKIKEGLRASLFWDVDFGKLDLDEHKVFVIVRVMERGTREEVRKVWSYYGDEAIKKHLLKARSLSPKTISFFSNQFNIPRSQFRSAVERNEWKY